MSSHSAAGSVLADVGIALAKGKGRKIFSLESLDQLDGDVMFIMTLQGDTEMEIEVRAEINRMKAHPLWSKLRAVQANRVYEVGSYWAIGRYIAANLILDDLLKL